MMTDVMALLKEGWNDGRELPFSVGNGLPYQIRKPERYDAGKRYPVLFYLHGNGSRGTDNRTHILNSSAEVLRLIESDAALREDLIIIAPQSAKTESWVDESRRGEPGYYTSPASLTPCLASALEILDFYMENAPTDADRVMLWGNSMGAYASFDLLSRFPHRFAGAICVAGEGDPSRAATLKEENIRIFHGTADTVVPFECGSDMARALKEAGCGDNIGFTVFEGRNHDIFPDVGRDPAVFAWLRSRVRGKTEL